MSAPDPRAGRTQPDFVSRTLGGAALVVAFAALVFAMAGSSPAKPKARARRPVAAKKLPGPSTRPQAYGLLRLSKARKYPASVIPTVAAARSATRLGGATRDELTLGCAPTTVDMGTYCIDNATYPLQPEDAGKNDFAYATRACAEAGGWLPSAAQLLGAAARVKLASTIDDNETTASIDIDRTDGLKDQREMSSTLFTVATGGSAAGSQGVTAGSKGDPRSGEPDPLPAPADPRPETVYYMTVYDNHDLGGFAGGQPISRAERFRCVYAKAQGASVAEER